MTLPSFPPFADAPYAPAQAAALFVDLSGVLLDSSEPQLHRQGLRAGVGPALRLLDRLDYRIVILAPCALDRRRAGALPHNRVADLLFRERIALAGFCRCNAAGSAGCHLCPPAPGLLLQAGQEFGIALAASWVLASSTRYIDAGQQAGCRTLLVGADCGDMRREWDPESSRWPPLREKAGGQAAYRSRDVVDAALAIVRLDEER